LPAGGWTPEASKTSFGSYVASGDETQLFDVYCSADTGTFFIKITGIEESPEEE
jgi:hypothetical protein